MKLLRLYLRSRLAVYALAGMALVVLLGWLAGSILVPRAYLVDDASVLTHADLVDDVYYILYPVFVFAPVTIAGIVGVSARSPFDELEGLASRGLPLLRFVHLFGLFVVAAVVFVIIASGWDAPLAGPTLVRNLAGISGIALITARLLGAGLSWTAPFAFVMVAQFSGIDSQGELYRWAWHLWPVTDYTSDLIALALLAIGLLVVCFRGARESLFSNLDF